MWIFPSEHINCRCMPYISGGCPRNSSRSLPAKVEALEMLSIVAPQRARVLVLVLPFQGFRVCVPDFCRHFSTSGLPMHMQNSDQVDVVNGSCSRWWRHAGTSTALICDWTALRLLSVLSTPCRGRKSCGILFFSQNGASGLFCSFFMVLPFSFFTPCTIIWSLALCGRSVCWSDTGGKQKW